MLHLLTRKWRVRSASFLVVLYAFCLAAPTTVLALGAAAGPAHCLTGDHHAATAAHDHQDETSRQAPGTGGSDHSQTSKCCGLFFASAIAPDVDFVSRRHPQVSRLGLSLADDLSGQDSDRIDRPPRSLQSI